MRIGVKMLTEFSLTSLQRIARCFYTEFSERQEVVSLPQEYPYVAQRERERMAEAFLQGCDVVAGVLDPGLLAARRRLNSSVPFVFFTPITVEQLRARSPGCWTRGCCCAPGPWQGGASRASWTPPGPGDVLRAAGRPRRHRPDRLPVDFDRPPRRFRKTTGCPSMACTRAGGRCEALRPLDVFPVWYLNTLSKTISMLKLTGRLHLVGPAGADRLRELYNAADVMANLTLNPHENFGRERVQHVVHVHSAGAVHVHRRRQRGTCSVRQRHLTRVMQTPTA